MIKDIQPVFWTITRVSNWSEQGCSERRAQDSGFQESISPFSLPRSFTLSLFNRQCSVAFTVMQHRFMILSSFTGLKWPNKAILAEGSQLLIIWNLKPNRGFKLILKWSEIKQQRINQALNKETA